MIPSHAGEIEPAWLSAVLHHGGALPPTSRVASIARTPIGVGSGVIGELTRLSIAYEGPPGEAPASLVVKHPARVGEHRAIGLFMRFYEREVRFYRELAPLVRLRVPRCYLADMDLETGQFIVLLEDLTTRFEVGDQVLGATLDQARAALAALADLHAQWWDAPALHAAQAWIPDGASPVTQGAGALFREFWNAFVANFGAELTPDQLRIGAAVRDRWGEFMIEAAAAPVTLSHSDFRLDNLFFNSADPSEPPLAVVDWQLVTRAHGALDVAYFLGGSLPVELRRAHERELIDGYLGHLRAAGIDVDELAFRRRYRAATLCNLVYAVAAGGPVEWGNQRGEALARRFVQRYFASAADHGATLL